MPLRILHLDTGTAWRGGQRQVYLLAMAQRDAGHEPLVVATPHSQLLRRARGAGLAVSAVPAAKVWGLRAVRRVARRIRTWRPDLVHAHDARGQAIALAALVGHREVPLVVTRRVATVPRRRILFGPRVARFIAISQAVREALVAGGVDPARIAVVHSGVPSPVVRQPRDWRAECGWPPECVVCGAVGALTVDHGISQLERIAARLPDAARTATRLVLLGGASAGLTAIGGVAAMRAGFVDEVHPALAGLDVLWHPATTEGLGTAVLDAMALGVPPIAFRAGGLPELIVDGECGILVEAGDLEGFSRAAAALVLDPGLRKRLGNAGPARAAGFSVTRLAERTAAVYAQVLAGHGRGVRHDRGQRA